MMPTQHNFQPPWLLGNRHIQSILASGPIRRIAMRRKTAAWRQASQSLLVEGAQGSQLLAYHTPAAQPLAQSNPAPLAILIHGWEGNAESGYLLSAAHRLWQQGYQIVRLNLRDHDHSHHLNRALFQSCRLDEVVAAIDQIMQRFPSSFTGLVGFSLGGNFALRCASALKDNRQLSAVVAVCPLIIPADTMQRLNHGPSIYRTYFKRKWLRSIEKKQRLFAGDIPPLNKQQNASLSSLTDHFVLNHTDFGSTEDYFRGYQLVPEHFQHLTMPVDVLMSEDDPIINAGHLSEFGDIAKLSIHLCAKGGHCGFIEDFYLNSWADNFILEKLNQYRSGSA